MTALAVPVDELGRHKLAIATRLGFVESLGLNFPARGIDVSVRRRFEDVPRATRLHLHVSGKRLRKVWGCTNLQSTHLFRRRHIFATLSNGRAAALIDLRVDESFKSFNCGGL